MMIEETAHSRAATLVDWAREVGFERAGVARLAVAERGEAFLRWLEAGDHAEMSYMARAPEIRLNPRTRLAGATSVLCVAQHYPATDSAAERGELWPGVARYARGRDYHNFMIKRLRKLARRIRSEFPGSETKIYVDTGPVLERELAAGAGLGAVGKNTMLLHPDAGSYFMLGEVFTTLDLEPGPVLADPCGSCTLCLEACPTGALAEPYRLDSRRCISYWTIEHRGTIPPAVRAEMGHWVFGCDVCQEVCPHNQALGLAGDPAFGLPDERARLDLEDILALDEPTYQALFQGSPMKRSRREGLRRNAAVAMGNRGESRFVPALAAVLDGDDRELAVHAAWALGRIGGERASEALEAVLGAGWPEPERSELENALEASRVQAASQ